MPGDSQSYRGRSRSHTDAELAAHSLGAEPAGLAISVLFTTVRGTLEALQHAARLACELQAQIQIVVPYVVPYPLPIDKASVDPRFGLRELITRCGQQPIQTRIDIWLCRDVSQCIQDGLRPNSLVVIGGRRSWWPWARENRLARGLRSAGHQVVLIAGQE